MSNEQRKHIRDEVYAAVRRVLSGDVDAYEIIHRDCDRPMRAFVWKRYRRAGPDFFDEVAARAHERALRHLAAYDPTKGCSYQSWLNQVALSEAYRVQKEWYGPRYVHFDEEKHEPWAVSETGPADEAQANERARLLGRAMESLAEDGRLCITLHDKEGLTFAETAKRTGLPVIRVRRARERALAKLRRELLRKRFNPAEVDSTPQPVWYGRNSTRFYDDDWTASVPAKPPVGPDTLVEAEAKDTGEEVDAE